jgi:hypothetical protein
MRALAAIACLWVAAIAAAQDVARARVVPETPAPGQPFRLEITIDSEAMDTPGPALRAGAELPMIEEIPLRFAGQRMGGLGSRGTTTLLVSGTAPRTPGSHRIPAFTLTFAVRKVRIPETTFAVRPLAPGETLGLVEAALELPERPLTLGETVTGRLVVRDGEKEKARGVWSVEARGEGVAFRNLGARSAEGGVAAEFEITPTRAGALDLKVGAVVLAETQGARGPETRDRPVVLSRPLRILPVPTQGRPADWAGAVGSFRAGAVTVSKPRPEIGEPFRLAVTLEGEGNFDRILPPEVPHGDAWDVLPIRESGRAGRGATARTFTYQLTPRLPGKLSTPAVRLSAFDPATRGFDRVVFPSVEVEVSGRAPERVELVAADPAAPAAPAAGAPPAPPVSRLAEPPATLDAAEPAAPVAGSGLAALNGALVAGLLGAVALAARREWALANPRAVARAKARRAARRARRRLARCDTGTVDRIAADGLRAAAAPLLDGRDVALTAEDVIRALGDTPASPVIRDCFRRLDGGRFGGAAPGTGEPARAVLIAALLELERRLCD